MDTETDLTIVGDTGACGSLKVSLIPTDKEGIRNLSEEIEENETTFDDPEDLLDKEYTIRLEIHEARVPENYNKDVYVEYSL